MLCELVPAVICSGFGKTEGSDLQLQDSAPDAAFSQAAGEALQKKTDVMEKQILSRRQEEEPLQPAVRAVVGDAHQGRLCSNWQAGFTLPWVRRRETH